MRGTQKNKYIMAASTSALILAGVVFPAFADDRENQSISPETQVERTGNPQTGSENSAEQETLFGKITEYNAGRSIKIETHEGQEKTFDLTGAGEHVNVGAGLKTGDAVKIVQSIRGGQRVVSIETHAGAGSGDIAGSHANGNLAQGKSGATADASVTRGTLKEYEPGKKLVVDVEMWPDREYNLAEEQIAVSIAPGIKVGDTVKLTEWEENGRKMVTIGMAEKIPSNGPGNREGSGTQSDPDSIRGDGQ